MGGIYALEQIAQDSPQDYCKPIMRTLAAYVRENARWSSEETQESAIAASGHKEPPADITTALTVLSSLLVFGREQGYVRSIKPSDDRDESSDESSLDSDLVDIRRTDLEGAHLEGIDLQEVRLGHSNLREAHLDNADLRGAKLQGVEGLTREQIHSAVTHEHEG